MWKKQYYKIKEKGDVQYWRQCWWYQISKGSVQEGARFEVDTKPFYSTFSETPCIYLLKNKNKYVICNWDDIHDSKYSKPITQVYNTLKQAKAIYRLLGHYK